MEKQNETDKKVENIPLSATIQQLTQLIGEASVPDDHLFYQLGNAYRKQGDFPQALNCYLEAMSINPDSPAAEAHQMLMNIMEYYHKDYYNP